MRKKKRKEKRREKRDFETKYESSVPIFSIYLIILIKHLAFLKVSPSKSFHIIRFICFYFRHVISSIQRIGKVTTLYSIYLI
jgi:hypothetical protein